MIIAPIIASIRAKSTYIINKRIIKSLLIYNIIFNIFNNIFKIRIRFYPILGFLILNLF